MSMYEVLELIEKHEQAFKNSQGVTRKDLESMTNISSRSLQKNTQHLVRSRYITMIIINKKTYYKTCKKDNIGGMINDVFKAIADFIRA